nr:hypothetical protein [Tanacetum cinerariifolium]
MYDVLKLTPFYKAFLVIADVPKIYMQEFWATATVHHHSIRFKMNNKKRIVKLEYFREMLQICPRIPNRQFDELPFEEEILALELGHSREIKMITDVEHKVAKKSNEMYYPRFTKVIVNFFMTKDQSIPRRNKYGAILPVKLTNEAIRNLESYKEYYVIASEVESPKTKESVRKKQSSSNTTMPPPTATGKRLKTLAKVGRPAKEKQHAKSSKTKGLTVLSMVALTETEHIMLATKRSLTQTHISHASGSGADEGTGIISGVLDVPTYEFDDEEISWKSSEEEKDNDDDDEQTDSDNDGDDFVHPKFSTHDEEDKDVESFNPIVQTPSQVENTDDEDNDEDSNGMNVEGDEGANKEDEANELYRDVNINLEGRDIQMIDVQTTQVIKDTHVTLTTVNPDGQQQSSFVSSFALFRTCSTQVQIQVLILFFESTPRVDVPVMTTAELPLLSTTTLPPPSIPIISHVQQTPAPLPANAISLILGIIDKYLDHRMNEAMKVVVRLQSDRLRDEAQAKNEDFLSKLDENIQKIIKEQVKEHVKTSHPVAADLSELELKKILIDKMESNKSIHRSDEQKNLYKALVDAYECDKLILDTYKDTVTLKRCRDDKDKDEEPSAGSNRGSKRRRAGKEPESTKEPMHTTQDLEEPAPQEFEIGTTDNQPVEEASQHPHWFQKQAKPPTPGHAWNKTLSATHGPFVMNQLKVDTLTPELLVSPTYELMKGSFIKTKAADYGHIKWIEDLVPRTMESARDVYSKRRIIAVTELQIVEWHNYKHLDWITIRRDDDMLYKFKEGGFKRLRIQDIKDMLLLLKIHTLAGNHVNEILLKLNLPDQGRSLRIRRIVKDEGEALTQPFKHSSPLAINLDPIELIFLTPPTPLCAFFDSLEDLPPRTTNTPPSPSFKSIERLENQLPPLPAMEPPLPPFLPQLPTLPPQLPPLGPKNPFPILTHEMFYDYCQRTQAIFDNLRFEIRFILNHILAMKNQEEVYNGLLAVKDAKCGEKSKLMALNDLIAEALDDIDTLEPDVEILDGDDNGV